MIYLSPDTRPRFFGYIAEQYQCEIEVLRKILEENTDIMRIVELGTGHGGMSLFFGSLIHGRGGKVLTIDIVRIMDGGYDSWNVLAEKYNTTFLQMDIFLPETVKEVSNFIKDYKALIFCDDGNKKCEVPLYAEILKKGDFLLAHDYNAEFSHEDLTQRTLSILEPYRQEEFIRILSMKRK